MHSDQKHDELYNSDLNPKSFNVIYVNNIPGNRAEGIVFCGGKGESVLNIGCGNGQLLYQFKDSFRELIGLEYSAHRLQQASVNLEGLNFRPIQGSAENMGEIKTSGIDRIVSADTIEHIPDIYAASAQMFRVLKPGGYLVINTPNAAFIKKRLLLLLGRFPPTSQPNEGIGNDILFDGGHLHYFTYRSLRIVLKKPASKW